LVLIKQIYGQIGRFAVNEGRIIVNDVLTNFCLNFE